jgi:hypothetical protein
MAIPWKKEMRFRAAVHSSLDRYPIFPGRHGSEVSSAQDFVSVRAFYRDLVNVGLVSVGL